MKKGKKYYSSKHKLYAYKVEISVLPNGLAVSCCKHYPGSISDLEIMRRMRRIHEKYLRKRQGCEQVTDIGPLSAEDPGHWGMLADKGKGAADFLRVIHPITKPPNKNLSISEERYNYKLSADSIVVENFFGRALGLWCVLERKWRCAEQNYDRFFPLRVVISNVHIRAHPLRRNDLDGFHRLTNRLCQIGTQRGEKSTLERYREKRRRRLSVEFRT